eukprot:1180086-Prorocentrum_minimum.AAC.3
MCPLCSSEARSSEGTSAAILDSHKAVKTVLKAKSSRENVASLLLSLMVVLKIDDESTMRSLFFHRHALMWCPSMTVRFLRVIHWASLHFLVYMHQPSNSRFQQTQLQSLSTFLNNLFGAMISYTKRRRIINVQHMCPAVVLFALTRFDCGQAPFRPFCPGDNRGEELADLFSFRLDGILTMGDMLTSRDLVELNNESKFEDDKCRLAEFHVVLNTWNVCSGNINPYHHPDERNTRSRVLILERAVA